MRDALAAIALLLTGCGTMPGAVSRDSYIPPAAEYAVCLNVKMTETMEQAMAACRVERGVTALSCAEYPRLDSGPQRLIFWRPMDFNDAGTLAVIGHELIHTLGGTHK